MKVFHNCNSFVVAIVVMISLANGFTTTTHHLQQQSNLRGPTTTSQQYASLITDDTTTTINNNIAMREGVTVSPYHILHSDQLDMNDPISKRRKLSLHSSLRLLRQALTTIAEDATRISIGNDIPMLRIEHTISHTVDPLCWLQAQTRSNGQPPSLYFATAEGTVEAAAFGSAVTLEVTTLEDSYWEMVRQLAPNSHLYGGQRFDTTTEANQMGDEWKAFSKGFWMLPAIEVRREKLNHNDTSRAITTIAVNLFPNADDITAGSGFAPAASKVLELLRHVTDMATSAKPPTTLPPVLSRISTYASNIDGQDLYETGVSAALAEFEANNSGLEKVVLARRMDLSFSKYAKVAALDILRKWKFGSKPGGHLFYINPGGTSGEFFGCTPERLFRVRDGRVLSEALAGTRPRGSTQQADEELSRQLFVSSKDQRENTITGSFIRATFDEMRKEELVENKRMLNGSATGEYTDGGTFYVRRLRHLQHLCQRYECNLPNSDVSTEAIQFLLNNLHPTPAVGGYPQKQAMDFIREYETVGFDRGFYSGPVGFVSKDTAEIVVAIRSGLVSQTAQRSKVSVFAGAGIVPGSNVQGEWAETAYKLAVVSSIFPQSPMTLQGAPTPNVAWATAFVEELLRNGVTQFYVCPGSRSTPLVAAIARAVRTNVGSVHALSVHDERSAGFRAVGYARGAGRPAAVVTSSGTAIANLYPSIIEAGMDGVPLILITADRPYESRDTGANQAIDQVKAFSSTYIRWFRDILPPNDDVPVSVGLADAAHGVNVAKERRGPVHFNIQFRENLAPDDGPIRNDDRQGSVTRYDGVRFTDTPAFQRWSLGGNKWSKSYGVGEAIPSSVVDVARLIQESKRGIIVVGNLRKSASRSSLDTSETVEVISDFAQMIGFPIFAGVHTGSLRFDSNAVVPFAEHLLRSPLVRNNVRPDLVLQLGTPLVSTEISQVVKMSMAEDLVHHVLIHPHHPMERADPEFTVSHKVDTEILPFIKALSGFLEESPRPNLSSQLVPIVNLGRSLRSQMPLIVTTAAEDQHAGVIGERVMTEPEIIISLSEMISDPQFKSHSLFLSNSMPVRDGEAFLYPLVNLGIGSANQGAIVDAAVNRGASGIDGIISSAAGFADSTNRRTTLLIGDVAALHDINALHTLRTDSSHGDSHVPNSHPMSIVVVNNDGGGIFSFLPVAKHGSDVSFEEFFGTPTNTFSFERGAEAFGLNFHQARNATSFKRVYKKSTETQHHSIIEAVVAPRDTNVAVHRSISRCVGDFIANHISGELPEPITAEILPIKYSTKMKTDYSGANPVLRSKTLVLLHGWMGDKSEWDDVVGSLLESLPSEWATIAIDLPGHGEAELRDASELQFTREALGIQEDDKESGSASFSIDDLASSVYNTLKKNGINSVEALAGYSLGGRVALAMKRMSMMRVNGEVESEFSAVSDETKMILISTFPGEIGLNSTQSPKEELEKTRLRLQSDEKLADEILSVSNRLQLTQRSDEDCNVHWGRFLNRWYNAPVWGELINNPELYRPMIKKRIASLSQRSRDLASVLRQCSPSRCRVDDWRGAPAERTLFVTGELDRKYSTIGEDWQALYPRLNHQRIPKKGHALLVEAPLAVAEAMKNFLRSEIPVNDKATELDNGRIQQWASQDQPPHLVVQEGSLTQSSTAECLIDAENLERIGSLDFDAFSLGLVDQQRQKTGVVGIGWGGRLESTKPETVDKRSGFIIQILSTDGRRVGIGEVSPLSGLHPESLEEVEKQLNSIATKISDDADCGLPPFDAARVLALDGGMKEFLDSFLEHLGLEKFYLSVRAGLEMALLSLASQCIRLPIHQALLEYAPSKFKLQPSSSQISLNGLITRGSASRVRIDDNDRLYESWKVKVGHQSPADDALALMSALQLAPSTDGNIKPKVRADANRGFNESEAVEFAGSLETTDIQRLEYVEEPLWTRISDKNKGEWTLRYQVEGLEEWFQQTSMRYALDESVLDLAKMHGHEFVPMLEDLRRVFQTAGGCAALVLKPSLLGLELSLQLARAARREFGIGAVFTSCFDTGIGLSYAAFLASLSDISVNSGSSHAYAHGLGTFSMLRGDCLDPSFGSYVKGNGRMNVASLSRAFFGLSLIDLRCLSSDSLPILQPPAFSTPIVDTSVGQDDLSSSSLATDQFEASTTISSDGREISVVASLPLPFSDDVACARFTDLPQQPRWSPWINSVSYLEDGETEWTLRVRGIYFRWRATSTLLNDPYKGIQWESVSGLKNTGFVEFVPDGDSCLMKVSIAFVTPRILSSLFRGTSVFFEDFLRNKVLKWSLEMFRDVVKGDLALEEGNVELGDALFGSVEGKASAIEATLSTPMTNN